MNEHWPVRRPDLFLAGWNTGRGSLGSTPAHTTTHVTLHYARRRTCARAGIPGRCISSRETAMGMRFRFEESQGDLSSHAIGSDAVAFLVQRISQEIESRPASTAEQRASLRAC